MWKDSWGGLSSLLSRWFGVPRPKPRMHVRFPPEFLHTYLPIPISLFALQQSTAQLCRKQVHVDPLCGVSINGLGGENVSRGQWTCYALPPPPPPFPSPRERKGLDLPETHTAPHTQGLYLLSTYFSHMLRQWGKNTRFLKIRFPEQRYLWAGENDRAL